MTRRPFLSEGKRLSVRIADRGGRCSIGPLSPRFMFHLQNISGERTELRFKVRLKWWAVAVCQLQGDICPVFWPQRLDHRREHDALLAHHVLPLAVDEIANDVVYGLTQQILVTQDALDGLSDAAEPPCTLSMFEFEIADSRGCNWIARFELRNDNILFRVMARARISP